MLTFSWLDPWMQNPQTWRASCTEKCGKEPGHFSSHHRRDTTTTHWLEAGQQVETITGLWDKNILAFAILRTGRRKSTHQISQGMRIQRKKIVSVLP